MAEYPYISKYPKRVVDVVRMYHRLGPYPLDPSSVFSTYDEMKAYVESEDSYAYPGQLITVANGDIFDDTNDKDFSLYVVKANKTIQPIMTQVPFTSRDEAEHYINNNPNTFTPGIIFTALEAGEYHLYTISEEGIIVPIIINTDGSNTGNGNTGSFTGTVKWDDIVNKPDYLNDLEKIDVDELATKDLVEQCFLVNDFSTNVLIKSQALSFRFLMYETFKTGNSIIPYLADGQVVIDNYINSDLRLIQKDDDDTVSFQLTPIILDMDVSSIYSLLSWKGTGDVSVFVSHSIDRGASWSEWTELVNNDSIQYTVSEVTTTMRVKISMTGKVIINGLAIGII